MVKNQQHILALSLREKGISLGEIAQTINISKSTASRWCKNVKLSKKQKDKLTQNRIKKGLNL